MELKYDDFFEDSHLEEYQLREFACLQSILFVGCVRACVRTCPSAHMCVCAYVSQCIYVRMCGRVPMRVRGLVCVGYI